MRKALAAATIAAALLISSAVPAQAATPAAAGAPCKTKNATSVVNSKVNTVTSTKFKCVTSGKKLVWDKGVVTIAVKTTLSISQVWTGNSVSLSIRDSKGALCDTYAVGTECYGFYIGWRSNFQDSARTVKSDNAESTISGLQLGDKGDFLLMYQSTPGSSVMPLVVKNFPFNYDY
jgi:hypothetical protein